MKQDVFPPGWDADRVKRVLGHYESQSEEEGVAEDEAAFEAPGQTVMEVPEAAGLEAGLHGRVSLPTRARPRQSLHHHLEKDRPGAPG